VDYFVSAFYAMVDEVVQITGCDRESLLDDFRQVHRHFHNSEEPYALLGTQTVRSLYGDLPLEEIIHILDPAFHAFNSARKRHLTLYPQVLDTLSALQKSGVRLVAHTESMLYATVDRLNRLGLFDYFEKIYCRERSSINRLAPANDGSWLDQFPMQKITELSLHQAKPNPSVLLEICDREGVRPSDSGYVGDSIARDILMARHANVFSIWAAYGASYNSEQYKALVRVSHWTEADVLRERNLSEEARDIRPDWIAYRSFAEVLDALDVSEAEIGQRKLG
jgi:phosphoglycolate phosphatase